MNKDATLSRTTRIAYGFGLSAEGIKNTAFNAFLLFFYQQVVGLDPLWCGAALFIALCWDAVTDPAVGVWSDGVRSRLGRRHPFMFAAGLPLALCFFAVFNPPRSLSQPWLFAWLVFFACATRFAMTLFVIPHASLVAELASDYDERTKLQSLRTVFGWMFGLINSVLAYRVFLRPTPEYEIGLLNAEGYVKFSIFGAVVMLIATQLSSAGTLRHTLAVRPPSAASPSSTLRELPGAIATVLRNRNYRVVVGMGLCGAVSFGMLENLGNYINTYFWGLNTKQLAIFIAVIFFASLVVLVIIGPLTRRFNKRNVAIGAAIITACNNPIMVSLKLLGVLPPNGSRELLIVLSIAVFVGYLSVIITMIMTGAMIADITDEHELTTGTRQEGLLFSAVALIAKASSGLGVMLASGMVKLVGFPDKANPSTLDPDISRNLAIFLATNIFILGTLAIWIARNYQLGRHEHAQILEQLAVQRTSA